MVMIAPPPGAGVTVGSSTHDGTISVVFGPRSAGATRPAAGSAAIGAEVSRPGKGAPGGRAPTGRELRCDRGEDIATVKCRARHRQLEGCNCFRSVEAEDRRRVAAC